MRGSLLERNADGLVLQVVVEALLAQLASDARLLPPAERQRRVQYVIACCAFFFSACQPRARLCGRGVEGVTYS